MPDPEGGMPEGSTEPDWADLFIETLRAKRSVQKACAAVGRVRSSVYEWREKSPTFKARWDEAFEEARAARFEDLEDSAFDRATHGTERAVFQGGVEVGTYRQFETALTIFLLKVNGGPRYRLADASETTSPQAIAQYMHGLRQAMAATVPREAPPPDAALPPSGAA